MDAVQNTLPTNTQELVEFLRLNAPQDPRNVDTKSLRYAIYARKSTTGDERQERSIPDQIKECVDKVVKPEELKVVVEPIEERGSAKDPDIRPHFRKLLDDIRANRIDGIIAWHPDRLSRNMKEAGEIIDLLDKGILKDLRFATSSFENSPTGKMLLGISFVLSKQYSEHLSESVTRGNRHKTEGGFFFDEMKHGYVVLSDGRLLPDGENFALIRQAFEKRLEGVSQPEIASWLNTTGYKVRKKSKDPSTYKWDKDSVSSMLKDPTYAGVLKYGNHYSNLEEFYDFTPVVSVEEFFKINKVKDFGSSKLISSMMSNKRETTKANLLRGIVFCGYCNKSFSSGLTPKKLKEGTVYYYFYKCETEGCEFKGKSVRANVMLEYAYEFLDTYLFTTEDNYHTYEAEANGYAKQQSQEISADIMRYTRMVGDKKNEYDRAKSLVLDNPALSEHYNLKEIKQELDDMHSSLETLRKQREDIKSAILTYRQYLELFQNLSVKLRNTHDMSLIDQVLRKFFSNFIIKPKNGDRKQGWDVTHKLKEPWSGFYENGNFDRGRG